MKVKRLDNYFDEAKKHIDLMKESMDVIKNKMPIKEYEKLSQIERFAINVLVFRFSKLQDLLGTKVFRSYLDFSGFDVSEKSFYDILKELEKESIIDIDSWNELRELRNKVAHEYPEEIDEVLESINLFIKKSDELIVISKKIEKMYHEIRKKRDQDHKRYYK